MSAAALRYGLFAALLLLALWSSRGHADEPPAAATDTVLTPMADRRGTEQTYLTYPEWLLVFSPVEYANFVQQHPPSDFPFWGHIGQFWSSYRTVYRASNDGYPFNGGYHVMILVIGTSTTVEYALRSGYETVIGRLSELTRTHGMTEEDLYAARYAQEYADFIRVRPWYEFNFRKRLVGLWRENHLFGPDMIRKWERKYILSTEFIVKMIYGWMIGKATAASYDEALPTTAVVLDGLQDGAIADLPDLKLLQRLPDGGVLATLPRYDPFMHYAEKLAGRGVSFREIAGNRSVLLVSAIVPDSWSRAESDPPLLFSQPILTESGRQRVVLVVPVKDLSAQLQRLAAPGVALEHVYDY